MKDEKDKKPKDLKTRTKAFALRVIQLYPLLPKTTEAQVIGKQLLRSGTSVGAHYREATRARSDAEFVSKIESCLQELEESSCWMELLVEADIVGQGQLSELLEEACELTAILVTCAKNAKVRKDKGKQLLFILPPSALILHPFSFILPPPWSGRWILPNG